MGAYNDKKAKTETTADTNVVTSSFKFGASEAFLLFLILILLVIGFSFF